MLAFIIIFAFIFYIMVSGMTAQYVIRKHGFENYREAALEAAKDDRYDYTSIIVFAGIFWFISVPVYIGIHLFNTYFPKKENE